MGKLTHWQVRLSLLGPLRDALGHCGLRKPGCLFSTSHPSLLEGGSWRASLADVLASKSTQAEGSSSQEELDLVARHAKGCGWTPRATAAEGFPVGARSELSSGRKD